MSDQLRKRTATIVFTVAVMPGLFAMITTDFDPEQSPREQPRADLAAVTKELERACGQTRETEEAEAAALRSYTSTALQRALRSEPEMWRFLVDPSTRYLDRMAAANQGVKSVSTKELPKLWKAVAAFEVLPVGVAPSPCEFLYSATLTWARRKEGPGVGTKHTSRVILGQKVDLPEKEIDYPTTLDERNHAPWLWQMKRALAVLNDKVSAHYADPERYPLLVEAAWGWQPSNWFEAHIRSRALLERGPRNVLWLQVIVKLALDEPDPDVASSVSTNLNVWGKDDYHFEELVHTAQIVILQNTRREPVAALTSYWTARLARDTYNSYSPQLKPLSTSTAVLAMGRWAMDRNLDPWRRYSSYAGPICQIVEHPPFQPGQIRDPESPEIAASLRAFEDWFTKQRDSLERAALVERPHLVSLATELHRKI